jgi:tRNA(Ile)-lysidine synthase
MATECVFRGLNGSKKVKDIFIDLKVPPRLRDRIPIVSDAEGAVIWIAGLRRSDIAEPAGHTERFFWLKSEALKPADF